MYKRKPDALVRKRTNKSAKERRQHVVSSSGSALGDLSVSQSLTKLATIKDEGQRCVSQLGTVTGEDTHDGSNLDADINTPKSDILSQV